MKTRFTILFYLFAFFYQVSKAQTMNTETTEDLHELQRLNAQFIKNFLNSDTLEHTKIIHQDFVCIQSNGAIVTRNEYMKAWASGYQDSGYTSFEKTEEHIRIFGNMALVRSRTPYTKMVNGKSMKGASVYTDTYVKEKGRWFCVQAQITAVK